MVSAVSFSQHLILWKPSTKSGNIHGTLEVKCCSQTLSKGIQTKKRCLRCNTLYSDQDNSPLSCSFHGHANGIAYMHTYLIMYFPFFLSHTLQDNVLIINKRVMICLNVSSPTKFLWLIYALHCSIHKFIEHPSKNVFVTKLIYACKLITSSSRI
ncbi:hypothetical protein Lalb_Chr19g0132141 [Lupinus albus]|uniref:Uncharacterized protein n=1 Tax=Lupinus albus TaxID=3870 RepID=A0A6A4NKU7_LUPAL|nr:hypothetical protein Lalb_Chr19g0132141 [Lupinus albus]